MREYEFHATTLMAEAFTRTGAKFDVVSRPDSEQLLAGFPVECGPNVIMRFISRDDDNDVAIRIYGLISNTPREKRPRMMEACNLLNQKIRYMKFYLDPDGSVNVEYDFPVRTPDEGVGKMAFEMFIRMIQILNSEYGIFMKALYSDEELDLQDSPEDDFHTELIERLQELREIMETRTDGMNDDDDDDYDEDDDNDEDEDGSEPDPETNDFLS